MKQNKSYPDFKMNKLEVLQFIVRHYKGAHESDYFFGILSSTDDNLKDFTLKEVIEAMEKTK
jgi:hypothetical protein